MQEGDHDTAFFILLDTLPGISYTILGVYVACLRRTHVRHRHDILSGVSVLLRAS